MNDVGVVAGEFVAWAVLFLGITLILAYRRTSLGVSSCILGLLLLCYWRWGSAPEWWKIIVSVDRKSVV